MALLSFHRFYMDFEIFAHEDYVGYTKYGYYTGKIEPAEIRKYKITSYNQSLNRRIDGRYQNVGHLQLVSHQLENMLAMRLSEVLMQHDSVADSQASVHAIHEQENQESKVFSCENQSAYHKQQNESNADTAHIARKAFRFPFRTEMSR